MVEPKKSRKYSHFKFVFYDLVIPSIPSIWNLASQSRQRTISRQPKNARGSSLNANWQAFEVEREPWGPIRFEHFRDPSKYQFDAIRLLVSTGVHLQMECWIVEWKCDDRNCGWEAPECNVAETNSVNTHHCGSSLWLVIVARHCGSSLWLDEYSKRSSFSYSPQKRIIQFEMIIWNNFRRIQTSADARQHNPPLWSSPEFENNNSNLFFSNSFKFFRPKYRLIYIGGDTLAVTNLLPNNTFVSFLIWLIKFTRHVIPL